MKDHWDWWARMKLPVNEVSYKYINVKMMISIHTCIIIYEYINRTLSRIIIENLSSGQ